MVPPTRWFQCSEQEDEEAAEHSEAGGHPQILHATAKIPHGSATQDANLAGGRDGGGLEFTSSFGHCDWTEKLGRRNARKAASAP